MPSPKCCSSGLAPQLLPELTCRWIVSGWSPLVTTLIRAPIAASIGLPPGQFQAQPVVSLAGVFEEDIVIAIAGYCASHLDEEIEVAVSIPIGTGDAMTLLEVSGTGRARDIGESPAIDVLEHAIGNNNAQVGAPVPR